MCLSSVFSGECCTGLSTHRNAQRTEASQERFVDQRPRTNTFSLDGIMAPVSFLSVSSSVAPVASASLPPRLDLPCPCSKAAPPHLRCNFPQCSGRCARGVRHLNPKSDYFQVRTEGSVGGDSDLFRGTPLTLPFPSIVLETRKVVCLHLSTITCICGRARSDTRVGV